MKQYLYQDKVYLAQYLAGKLKDLDYPDEIKLQQSMLYLYAKYGYTIKLLQPTFGTVEIPKELFPFNFIVNKYGFVDHDLDETIVYQEDDSGNLSVPSITDYDVFSDFNQFRFKYLIKDAIPNLRELNSLTMVALARQSTAWQEAMELNEPINKDHLFLDFKNYAYKHKIVVDK